MTLALRLFYRTIHTTGLQRISEKGPVIVIANHSASLMDAAVIGILVNRPVHFFTRGDIFQGRFIKYILRSLKMIPVHHHIPGKNPPASNDESFARAREILANGGVVLFFPEGNSHLERRLHTFRKGVFRLAFQAAETDYIRSGLRIIPVGINYTHPIAYREDVMVHAGEAIFIKDYYADYLTNPAAALLHITRDCHAHTARQMIHVPDADMRLAVQQCLGLKRNEASVSTVKWLQHSRKKLDAEQQTVRNFLPCSLSFNRNCSCNWRRTARPWSPIISPTATLR